MDVLRMYKWDGLHVCGVLYIDFTARTQGITSIFWNNIAFMHVTLYIPSHSDLPVRRNAWMFILQAYLQ